MSRYYGFSMSNNAIDAYHNGEKPLSKWTKADIINEIEEQELELKCSLAKLKKLSVKLLKGICLTYSSWHHTSSHYNKTNFYSLDIYRIENISDKMIDELLIENNKEKAEDKPKEEKWKCAFLEWSGSRNHPKATEVIEVGVIKGNWFYRKDGSKKKTTANGFKFIEQIH